MKKSAQTLRVALAQINPTVGDLEGNARKVRDAIRRAESMGADVLLTPELVMTGYPPEDLLFKKKFVESSLAAVWKAARETRRTIVLIGCVHLQGQKRYNAAAVCRAGSVHAVYHKILLPNYGVFDEKRYFSEGSQPLVLSLNGIRAGVTICEDLWSPEGPCRALCEKGKVELLLNLSSSPYHAGKVHERLKLLKGWAKAGRAWVLYCNCVGGQDELVFDGHSLVVNPFGRVVARGLQFEEDFVVVDMEFESKRPYGRPGRLRCANFRLGAPISRPALAPARLDALEEEAEIYKALVMGTGDYVRKNGFTKVLIGLSGGIDSALTAAIAADALGSENVVGFALPSRFTSEESVVDAKELADRLRIDFRIVPIEPPFKAMLEVLSRDFAGLPPSEAEENLQARIRGTLLMTLSNKFGRLVLTTGNKSEISTGYCTLYGDTAGGFAVIKDIPKTLVYRLSRYRNTIGPVTPPPETGPTGRKLTAASGGVSGSGVIPDRVLEKAPTAELRANQKDTDSLPPYEVLDPILKQYVEEDRSVDEIARSGQDRKLVERVAGLVERSEYKRRQAAPGVKITPKAFGRDRRMPLTNRFRG
ncbi:MAG: NAD+ synthase [Nitrospirae bacterium]|nr:NAD+ synthase [Nitrospirota bacterium]